MKILFIGDIVGEPGRVAVKTIVPRLRELKNIDYVVANGENAAGGSGITSGTARELLDGGVDVITTGDHAWDQKDIYHFLATDQRLLRPINYPDGVPGQGSVVIHHDNLPPLAVINVQGQVFMAALENPFITVDKAVRRVREVTPCILIDIHAEATSEKIAMGRFLDGRVSAVLGTHTHVQTADEQIFPNGTAFLCDAGFTGPHESVLGRQIEPVIQRFLTHLPQRFPVASGRVCLQGALVEMDPATGRATHIERVSEMLE